MNFSIMKRKNFILAYEKSPGTRGGPCGTPQTGFRKEKKKKRPLHHYHHQPPPFLSAVAAVVSLTTRTAPHEAEMGGDAG